MRNAMQSPVTAAGLLGEADRLMAGNLGVESAFWPRACAVLVRAALEASLDEYWTAKLPAAVDCPMRAQLLLLKEVAGRGVAEAAADAWNGLSRAAHHHAYELCPTAVELRQWHTLVVRVAGDLGRL